MIEHARWTLGKSLKDFRTGIADETEVLSAIEALIEAKKYLPQRQWVGLTDEEFLEACQIAEQGNYLVAFKRLQEKLKDKNT